MSGIDPRYLLMPVLWEVFTDKDELTFLNDGYILFFRDLQRTVGKKVYKLSGTPPAYTYIEYGSLQGDGSWRVDLNAQGALEHALYFYPYDADGNNENYFIQWFSADDVPQNSREAWPNLPTTGGTGEIIDLNLVPNPQFLLHTVLPATDTKVLGEIREDITPIAYGGWTYERTPSSTAKDIVTFLRNGSPITNPAGNPRYWATIQCVTPAGDSYKRLALTFEDVNKFANGGVTYTIAFNAYGATGLSVPLYAIQNFGSGGSPTVTTLLDTYSITTSNAQYVTSFTFPSTSGKVLGTNDDDFVQLVLSLPANAAFTFYVTDALLTDTTIATPVINDQPDSVYVYQSTAGFLPVPAYDGSDLYLPIILTRTGFGYDTSKIGTLEATLAQSLPAGYLLCDGSQYETNSSSSDGIPYARLQSVLFDATFNCPITGTGANFVTSVILTTASLDNMTLFTNKIGAATLPTNGAPSPGFTFSSLNTPITHNLMKAYYCGTHILYIQNNTAGEMGSFTPTQPFSAYDGNSGFGIIIRAYGEDVRQQVEVQCAAASAITAGHYFVFKTPTDSFYVWYKKDGSGSDPAPAGITYGIKVEILSTHSSDDVARLTTLNINAFQIFNALMVAASAIPQSSYWNFTTLPTNNYYVWYNKAGGGTDPAIAGKIGIEVDLAGTETAAQVATATMIAINKKYFAVPDCRGAILRGLDPTSTFDPDALRRFSNNYIAGGAFPGTYELDENQSHSHNAFFNTGGVSPSTLISDNTAITDLLLDQILSKGGKESRPYNMAVNYIIKY